MASNISQKHTFSLPNQQGRYIDRLVKSGAYASASEVVRAGLRALAEREDVEDWLRTQVVASARALKADPSRAVPASQVFAEMRAMVGKRKKPRVGRKKTDT